MRSFGAAVLIILPSPASGSNQSLLSSALPANHAGDRNNGSFRAVRQFQPWLSGRALNPALNFHRLLNGVETVYLRRPIWVDDGV
jgi:hypothetical protein